MPRVKSSFLVCEKMLLTVVEHMCYFRIKSCHLAGKIWTKSELISNRICYLSIAIIGTRVVSLLLLVLLVHSRNAFLSRLGADNAG